MAHRLVEETCLLIPGLLYAYRVRGDLGRREVCNQNTRVHSRLASNCLREVSEGEIHWVCRDAARKVCKLGLV